MQQVFSGPRPLTHMLRTVMKPVFRHRSFTEASIILDWHKIMNAELAQCCYPERLIFPRGKKEGGILVIAVDSGSSLLIQHSENLLINWINSYFGYQAVNRIKLNHTFISKTQIENKTSIDTISSSNETVLAKEFDDIHDPELKIALFKFKQSYDRYNAHKAKKDDLL